MKTILSVLIACACLVSNAATFTFHACKDNWTEISVLYGDSWDTAFAYQIGYWDYGYDLAFPSKAYSGLEGEINQIGYSDTISFSSDYPACEVDVWLCGGYPDYGNGQINFDLPRFEGGVDLINGGEVWIDFGPDGIGRIELVKPADFGKWAWDGSINPSWVEPPLAPTANGRRLAKGHSK